MKSIALVFSILACGLLTAQEGIVFSDKNWDEILAVARTEEKLIFLDAYTTWCGPCKLMSREVFPDPEVGEFYNANFINAKVDMEKGAGLQLADRYEIMAYPSLLYIDGDGQLMHRATGYRDVDGLLETGRTALNPLLRLTGMRMRYEAGERDPAFLFQYAYACYDAYDGSHGPVAEAYLKTQRDWSTPENMEFIYIFLESAESPMFDYLVKHRAAFQEMYGSEDVIQRVQSVIINSLREGEATPQQIEALYGRAFPEKAGELSARFRMDYYSMAGDVAGYADAAVSYFRDYPSDDPYELNNAAWTFYEVVEDTPLLQEALAWAQRSVALSDEYFNNDTLAALYYKLNLKKKARKAARYAVKLAKKNGEDYSGTQELLEKIERM